MWNARMFNHIPFLELTPHAFPGWLENTLLGAAFASSAKDLEQRLQRFQLVRDSIKIVVGHPALVARMC
jgi:hypothetical protein